MRQIVLDTETTGLSPEHGHRIIEIGCIEIMDRKVTDNHFQAYINPEREVDKGALAVHGITNNFLEEKPLFQEVVESFIDYIAEDELIIHNAVFDIGFINAEFSKLDKPHKLLSDKCSIIDTLALARKLHPGQRNNLDALCKRYHIDNTKRNLHGALLDAQLLAEVYLMMTSGQSQLFAETSTSSHSHSNAQLVNREQGAEPLTILRATEEELLAHHAIMDKMGKEE